MSAHPVVLAAVILTVGVWAYAPSFGGVFVLDDVRAIVENPTIRTVWPLSMSLSPPTETTVAGRPLANLSFAISYAARSANDPIALETTAFHAGNLLIHLAAALVLFGIVLRTLESPRLRATFGAAAPWLALAVALVWMVHPIQTAAVTYVVQRVESLMGLFYLLTLYCAIRAASGSSRGLWTAAAIASCACGMATKEVMVTAPIMVALWGRHFGVPEPGGFARPRWPLLAGLAATWLVLGSLVFFEHRVSSVSLAPAAVWAYLLTQAGVVLHYLRLAVVPAPLCLMYDWPLATSIGSVAWQSVLLTALIVLTAVAVVRRHPAGFLGAWFFLILAPSSSFLPIVTEVAAEHRMYLPLAAVVAAVVTGAFLLGQKALGTSKAAIAVSAAALVIVVGSLSVETRARNRVYGSADGLWQDTVDKRPADVRSRVGYADMLSRAGRLGEAEAQLRAALELAPRDALACENLGSVLAQQNKLDAAIPYFEAALAVHPDHFQAHRSLAGIFAIQRKDRLAVHHYEQTLAALPDDAELTARLAAILADSSDPSVRDAPRALALAERAVSLTSGRDPRMLEILSLAQAASGRFADAASTARAALEMARARGDRGLVSALEYRASAYDAAARRPAGPGR
jgi:protein O-mannosyl-transferase